jgi:hypothetical protein
MTDQGSNREQRRTGYELRRFRRNNPAESLKFKDKDKVKKESPTGT